MRLIVYTRQSSRETEKASFSIETQGQSCALYCQLHADRGLELVGHESDPGLSGGSLERPGLQSALARIKRGEADGIIVSHLDRFTRNLYHWSDLMQGPLKSASLICVSESIDSSTPIGRMFANVLISFAHYMRESAGERTAETCRYRKQQGNHYGRVPYGWVRVEGKLHVEPYEQKILGKIRELHRNGESLGGICRKLNDEKVKTSLGGPWRPSTLQRILRPDTAGARP
jgi:site-specific DNA recombinase